MKHPITVVNKRTHKPTGGDVYIGRPSVLGNPYVIGKDGTRAEVIAKYEAWLRGMIEDDTRQRTAIQGLVVHAHHRPLNLVCWCNPADCHGRIIKEIIEELI